MTAQTSAERLVQLRRRLFPRAEDREDATGQLFVTVVRAANFNLPALRWFPPQAVVALGHHERRSPLGEAFGAHPIFDWRTELPFTGHESHLVFEVVCEGVLVGSCLVPLQEVLSGAATGGFRRALPLAETDQEEPPELYVMVTTSLDGDVRVPRVQEEAARQLRARTSQIRVTLRSLRVAEKFALDNGTNKIFPYVSAACGQQVGRTKAAFLTAGREDFDKFVFTGLPNSNFECGELLRGRWDKYRPVPSSQERHSSQPQYGYRMRVETSGLQLTYCNVEFTFWYQQQELLELSVFDDIFLVYPDPLVATGALDLNEAFRLAFTEDGMLLDDDGRQPNVVARVPLSSSIASLRPSGILNTSAGAADGGDGGTGGSTSSHVAGEIELQIEFMEEPVACPTALESTFRGAIRAKKEASDLHQESLQYLADITEGDLTASGLPPLEDLFSEQRRALAILCTSCAVATARRLASHEGRVSALFSARLHSVTEELCRLLVPQDATLQDELFSSARSAVPYRPIEEAAKAYRQNCRPPGLSQLELLLPLGALLAAAATSGSLLRTTLRKAADAIEPTSCRGRLFFDLMERHLVAAGRLVAPEAPSLELAEAAAAGIEPRDLAVEEAVPVAFEQQDQLRRGRAAMYTNFFPEIEWSRLLDKELEETKVAIIPGKYRYIIPSSLALGAVCGAVASISYVETAVILHTLDERILCHEDYSHLQVMKGACWLVKDSHIDGFMEWVATSPRWLKALFGIFGVSGGTVALQQLRRRYFQVREMSLQPLGPCLSPHKVICVSGFLRSLADVCQPWSVEGPWTSGQVCFLRFETQVLYQLGNQLRDALARDLKRTENIATFLVSLSNPISFQQLVIRTLLEELGDLLDQACERARQVGHLLAKQLVAAAEASQGRLTVSLLGYSAGGVVVQSCLQGLQELRKDGHDLAADLVCDAILLGTPAAALSDEWSKLRELVTGRFVNGFFAQDGFLLSHQFRRGGSKLAGCSPLHAPDVENIPMDPYITTHNEYPEQMSLILHRIFNGGI